MSDAIARPPFDPELATFLTALEARGPFTLTAEMVPHMRQLDVTEETPGAWRLYERRGWRLTHRSPADWAKPDGTVSTMRWYEKRLR